MSKVNPSNLNSFESNFLFSLQKEEKVSFEKEREKIKELQKEVEYLLSRYSTLTVNNIRVADGLINPTEYLKSLLKILANQSFDTRLGKLLDKFSSEVVDLENYLLIERKLFRYGLKHRPLMIGAVPLGFIGESIKEHPKFRYGTIDYPKALSEKEMADYELTPLFLEQATIKWCIPEQKKALELGITLPTNEITAQEAVSLIDQMKAYQNKLPASLQKHWQSMIARLINAFGASFEQIICKGTRS